MNEQVKVQEDHQIDLKMVGVDEITENDWNPNAMEMESFNTLVDHIESEGMVQPVLVRKTDTGYEVVDGAHRVRAARMAGLQKIAVVVVDYDEDKAKFRTVSMNRLRGDYIPLKMAKLLASLQDDYSNEEIRRMTGIQEEEYKSLSRLLEVPEIDFGDAPEINTNSITPPVHITIMMMPEENLSFEQAMVKAMTLAGDKVVPLVGEDVAQYDKAMTAMMGVAGTKLRNVALTSICRVFNALPKDQQAAIYEEIIDDTLDGKLL